MRSNYVLIYCELKPEKQYSTIQYSTVQCNTIQYCTMQYNTVLYNAIQCNTIQYSTVQCNTMQYNTILYNTMQYNTVLYNAMQCNAMQYSTVQCNAIQYCTMQCNAMQYSTVQCNTIQCNTMQCNTIQCNTIQCNAMQCNANIPRRSCLHQTTMWCLYHEDSFIVSEAPLLWDSSDVLIKKWQEIILHYSMKQLRCHCGFTMNRYYKHHCFDCITKLCSIWDSVTICLVLDSYFFINVN